MWDFIQEKLKSLITGSVIGIVASVHFFWFSPVIGSVVVFFLLKLVGTALLAATSAIFTALGTDLWKNRIKPLFSKKNKNGKP